MPSSELTDPPTNEPAVAEQFEDAAQQRHAATLGMWVFLATEVLFFGGLFLGYAVYRFLYPEAFRAAGAHTLGIAGGINTAILLGSSFVMVLAVRASKLGQRQNAVRLLALTALLGTVFLGIKAFEYKTEIHEGLLPGVGFRFEPIALAAHARIFFSFYFTITGLHAVHVTIGIALIALTALRTHRARELAPLVNTIDLLGLYWHFVDVVWVFVYPLIYLMPLPS